MTFSLSNSSIEMLKDTNLGVAKRIAALMESNPETGKAVENLIDTLFLEFYNAFSENVESEVDASFREKNKTLYAFTDFMAKAVVLSYYGMLDNDKNLGKLKQRAEEAHQKAVEEGRADDVKLDFKFGFQGLIEIISVALGFIGNGEVPRDRVEGRTMSNMLSSIRGVGLAEYLSGGYANMDIELVSLLSNRSESELSEFVISAIRRNSTYNTYNKDIIAQVMGVYKYLFQDSFGLQPYVGVLSFSEPYIRVIDDTMRLNTLRSDMTGFRSVGSALRGDYDVKEMLDRQFDIKAIIRSRDTKPCYYPIKILEYAMGRELTCELSENVYRKYAHSRSWEEYAEGYVEPNIERNVLECIYYTLEEGFDFNGVSSNGREDFFLSNDFNNILSDAGEDKVAAYFGSDEMKNRIYANLEKLKSSLCTAVVVVKYNNFGGSVNSLTLRIVNTTSSLNAGLSEKLFGGYITNDKIEVAGGDMISAGKKYRGSPLAYDIFEYRHDFDEDLSNAEPLFGYKAVEMFAARGIPLSWDRILLGEDLKGTPVFASMIGVDDFHMQDKLVHNMVAGSRAGKGVMTMNMLVSGLASGKPIFYIDRKPDMAILFYELSGGNMFVVNGGQDKKDDDINGLFADTGVGISGWDAAYDRMPGYVRTNFFPQKTYSGAFGDMVYYRAVMFVLGILVARGMVEGTDLDKIGGETGIILVIDEFTNWQSWEQDYFGSRGKFCVKKMRLTEDNIRKYTNAKESIRVKTRELEMYQGDPKKEMQAEKVRVAIDSFKRVLKTSVSEESVYCTTLMELYSKSIKLFNEQYKAGLENLERRRSDIFVIGQNIDRDGFNVEAREDYVYHCKADGEYDNSANTQGKSIMRGILTPMHNDWFMGKNLTGGGNATHYLNANEKGSPADKWLVNRQYWAYCGEHQDMDEVRKGMPRETVFFKPYLVLNKHFEDDPKNPNRISRRGKDGQMVQVANPDYTYVSQCRARVNDAVKGAELWEQVRLKHLKSEAMAEEARAGINKHYGELNEGIGFQGLASQTKMANGGGVFDPSVDLGASKAIADYVAQCMGYSCYTELLFDFTPDGMFSAEDVVNAISNPGSFQANKETRLHLFYEFGFMDNSDMGAGGTSESQIAESDFYNPNLYDSLEASSGQDDGNMNQGYDSIERGYGESAAQENTLAEPVASGQSNISMFEEEQLGYGSDVQENAQGIPAAQVNLNGDNRFSIPTIELVNIVSKVFVQTMNLLFQKYKSVNLNDPVISNMCNVIVRDTVVEYLTANGYEVI